MEHILFIEPSTLWYIFGGVVFFCFLVQCYYWLIPYRKLATAFRKNPGVAAEHSFPPVSVLLITKDAGKLLAQNLPSILEQDYPDFEVIIVDEHMKGEDEDTIKLLQAKYPNLYRTFLPDSARYISRRRLGVSVGLKAAKYEWVVLTDPSCNPNSRMWLRNLMGRITPETDIVLGYSNYEKRAGFWATRIVLDGMFHAMRSLGAALRGNPYMGMATNMAVRKEYYLASRILSMYVHLKRGEDDLFVNAFGNKKNTQVALGKESVVSVQYPPYKRLWIMDKINYLVTGALYKGWASWCNAWETLTAFCFKVFSIIGIVYAGMQEQWYWVGGFALLLLVRYLLVGWVLSSTAKAVGEKLSVSVWWYDFLRTLWAVQLNLAYWFRTKSDYYKKTL